MSTRGALTVARWEVSRAAGSIDRRTAVAAIVVLGLGVLIGPVVIAANPAPDAGIYRVAASSDSPFAEPIDRADSLRRVPPQAQLGSGADLAIRNGAVRVADSGKGRAALSTLRQAVAVYNDRLLREEGDTAAAFPVRVRLRYGAQAPPEQVSNEQEPTEQSSLTDADSPDDSPTATVTPATSTVDESDTGSVPVDEDRSGGDLSGAITEGRDAILGGSQSTTPGGLTAPFPVRSLVLAFVFVLPLNVIIQAYGSSVMAERLDRRGEALLVSPVGRYAIVAGKTIPYLLAAALVSTAIALAVGGGVLSVLAILPLAALFLAATFVAALFARSYRELSFLTVSVSVALTAFAFVPAVFTEVTPIAAISPLSIVVYDLTGVSLTLSTVAFATVPVTLVAIVLFILGVGVFREEDLFTQRPVPAKVLDAFAVQLTSFRRVALWSALLVPFALVAELFVLASLFAVQAPVTIPVLLAVVAIIEELAKSGPVYAGFQRDRFPDTDRAAVMLGIFSGLGFAIAEKIVLAVQAVGLSEIALARAAFAPIGQTNPLSILVLLLAPFALHMVTATVAALGARRSPRLYGACLCVAILGHVAYNLTVVTVGV